MFILNLQNKFTVLGHFIQNLSSRILIHTNRNLQNSGIPQILYDLNAPSFEVFFHKTKRRRLIAEKIQNKLSSGKIFSITRLRTVNIKNSVQH